MRAYNGGRAMSDTAKLRWLAAAVAAAGCYSSAALAQVPAAIAAKDENVVSQVHAEGAQIYECKADAAGKLTWQFREPIASLFRDGKTVGRHYAGPTWEDIDGSIIVAKVIGRAPGASAEDIPLLKLEVSDRRGTGALTQITAIQRVNTDGGVAEGTCDTTGEFQSVAYSADYIFLRKK
jgi:hypothetical protein